MHAASRNADSDAPAYGAGGDGDPAGMLRPDHGPAAPTARADPSAPSTAHTDQYRDFLGATAAGRPPEVTVAEATQTLGDVCAAYESVRSGRAVPVPCGDPAAMARERG